MIGIVYLLGFEPYIGITSEDIQMIAALGAGLDFDVMIAIPDENE